MNKVEHYDWAKPGDRGRQCLIRVDDLKIDHSYQRAQLLDGIILAIARNFQWSAFGALVVMERENGDKYVVDGQQRLAAAKRRGDIQTVPCIVFRSDGKDHEALAFLSLNTSRRPVSAIDKFNAAARACLEPQVSVMACLKSMGLSVSLNGSPDTNVTFPDNLCTTWRRNEDNTRKAIAMQLDICGGEDSLNQYIHKGLFYMLCDGVDVSQYIDKIKREGGKTALLGGIKRVKTAGEFSGTSEKVAALGILHVINKKRRYKTRLSTMAKDGE